MKAKLSAAKKSVSKRRGHLGLGRTQTRIAGKFRTQYTEQRLYDTVRTAALHCRPSYPKELRQKEFDDCRAEIGHADAPSARQICQRLKRAWADILSDAVDQPKNQAQKDSVKKEKTTDDAPWLTTDHVFYALRRAARHLEQPTVTAAQYEVARAELISADRKKHTFGGYIDENMPTTAQIERIARNAKPGILNTDWERACVIAKLPKPGSEEAGEVGKPSRAGLPIEIAIHYYVEASGGLLPPSRKVLDPFARLANIAVQRQPAGAKFTDYIHKANEHRIALGLEPASELAPRGKAAEEITFDLSKLDLGSAPAAVVSLSYDQKLEKIAEFLDYCAKVNTEPKTQSYQALAPKKGWPSISHLGETQGWPEWVIAADEWRAKKAKKVA